MYIFRGLLRDVISCENSSCIVIRAKRMGTDQTRDAHTKRQATQHGCLPSLLGDVMGTKELKYCTYSTVRKKIIGAGPTRTAKAEQTSLLPARQTQRTIKEGPFHLYSLSSQSPNFNSQQWPPLCSPSGPNRTS